MDSLSFGTRSNWYVCKLRRFVLAWNGVLHCYHDVDIIIYILTYKSFQDLYHFFFPAFKLQHMLPVSSRLLMDMDGAYLY